MHFEVFFIVGGSPTFVSTNRKNTIHAYPEFSCSLDSIDVYIMDYIFFRGSNPSDIAWLVARVCMLSIGVCQTLRDLSEHTHFCIQPTDIEVLKFRVIGSSSSKFILFCCPSAEPPSIYIIIYIVCTCIYTLVTCRELCVTACPTVPFILVTLYVPYIDVDTGILSQPTLLWNYSARHPHSYSLSLSTTTMSEKSYLADWTRTPLQ